MVGIYKITSPSGKVYIGQSTDIFDRWRKHKRIVRDNVKLYRSLSKYGSDNHIFEVVHELPIDVSKEILTQYEQLYMDQYRDCGVELLNTCPVAQSCKGVKMSRETREKMSNSKKGTKKSAEWSAKAGQWLKEANVGRKLSPDHKEKVLAALRNGPKRKNTPELREKLSIAAKKQWETMSDETKAKIKKASSDAGKKKVGTKLSEEHKKSVSEGLKKYYSNKKRNP